MAVALVALAGAGCSDDPSATEQRSSQIGGAAADAGLPTEVSDLLADAAAGVDGTYRVVYEVADPAGGDPQRVIVTQRPPDRRLDIERADGTAEATIRTDGRTDRCERTGADAEWSCTSLPAEGTGGLFDPDVVAALGASLAEAADQYDFAVDTRTIAGVAARCLTTTRKPGVDDPALGATATLCLSAEGAQLLTEVPTGTIRAVEYASDVADDAFALPTTTP